MRRMLCFMLVAALASPALRADDKPKDDEKKNEQKGKDKSPKEQYQELVKEFNTAQSKTLQEYQKTKGAEQQKLLQKYFGLGKEFAAKFYKLAEDNPKDPAATDALFWVLQNGSGSEAYKKAGEKLAAQVGDMPFGEISRKIGMLRGAPPAFAEAVFKRALKDEKEPASADLFFWVMQNAGGSSVAKEASEKVLKLIADMPLKDLASRLQRVQPNPTVLDAVLKRAETSDKDPQAVDLQVWIATRASYLPQGKKAMEAVLEKHPDHPGVEQICATLRYEDSPKIADALKKVIEKAEKPSLKSAATLALARTLANQANHLSKDLAEANKLAEEAEKYFTAIEESSRKAEAERELKAFQTIRAGKETPEIKAEDLDKKDFKLSDYRGKVVLLDFWGNW